MAFTRRKFRGNLKSLLHFDYPYYLEPGDGCRDEIGLMTWTRQGGTKFVGTEIPNDAVVVGTPKFGYRCAHFTATDYIQGMNNLGIWNLSSNGNYEIEMFVRPTSAAAGNILALREAFSDILLLAKDESNRLAITSTALGLSKISTSALELNEFSHVLLRFSGGTARVFLNGVEVLNQAMTGGVTLIPTEIRLGCFVGQMDEFAFRHSAGTGVPAVPVQPYQGFVDIHALGGYGNGAHGDITIPSRTSTQINTYARVLSVDGKQISISPQNVGYFGEFVVGDEVMLHASFPRGSTSHRLGGYTLRRIAAISGNSITLNDSEDKFLDAELFSGYYIQIISVPNFRNLVIDGIVTPCEWTDSQRYGGIIVFRCQNDCTINGRIELKSSSGPTRKDLVQMTHSQLVDRFLVGGSGGVFIVARGKIKIASTAAIGGGLCGNMKGGKGVFGGSEGGQGGAGYGGGGHGCSWDGGQGGNGGVGGGGGQTWMAGASARGGDAGQAGRGGAYNGKPGTGGGGAIDEKLPIDGGIAGVNVTPIVHGGGGAGGGQRGGPCAILAARRLECHAHSISTGGYGAGANDHACSGGTGFCFIAAEEVNIHD